MSGPADSIQEHQGFVHLRNSFLWTFTLSQCLLWWGRSALAHPHTPDGVKRNWVTNTCLSVNMDHADAAHPTKPHKAMLCPPLCNPPAPVSSPSPHLWGVTESNLVLVFSFFPPEPLKNPRYPCNFRCNVYMAEWGPQGGEYVEKESHSQFGQYWSVNMCRRGCGRNDWG